MKKNNKKLKIINLKKNKKNYKHNALQHNNRRR